MHKPLEETLLRMLAGERFCALTDIEGLIRLESDLSDEAAAATAVELLTKWERAGWAETAEMDPGGQVSLTDKAFADMPWLGAGSRGVPGPGIAGRGGASE